MRRCDDIAIQDYALKTLPPDEAARLEGHIRGCADCARALDEYRAMFAGLEDLPLPPVPAGIAEAVLIRLRQPEPKPAAAPGMERIEPAFARERRPRRLAAALRNPVTASVAGGLVGLLIALFRHPLILFSGRVTHGFVTGGSSELIRGLRILLHDLLDLTVLVHTFIDGLTKIGPISQQFGEAARSSPYGPTIAISLALFAATAFLIGRVVGNLGREKLGHAKR